LAGVLGRPDGINSLAVFPSTLWKRAFISPRDRGIVESVTSEPSGVAICRYGLGTGAYPSLLLHTGTSGLLAVLQLGVWFIGPDCFWKRTRLLRRRPRYPLGEDGSPSDASS